MDINVKIVMPADVILLPVRAIPAETRANLAFQEGDYSLTRPRSRIPSSIVSGQTAGLLEVLRDPMTIVDAVISYSRSEKLDPDETLVSAFPVLQRLINSGLLLNADSHAAKAIETTFHRGRFIGSLQAIEAVYLMIDTEVYAARTSDGAYAALKIARAGAETKLRRSLAHEGQIVDKLDGKINPRLIEQGEIDDRPFLAVSWCSGVDVYQATEEARRLGYAGRRNLLALSEAVIAAYAHLHRQGVLHGDVHPRNVLVDEKNKITLIDFGLAVPFAAENDAALAIGRGCIDLFMEPELALAYLLGDPPPRVTAASEQYTVATLIYLLLTGTQTHDFVLEAKQMRQQVAYHPPISFDENGVSDLQCVEIVLRRALDKDPAQRFPTMSDFQLQFAEASAADLGQRKVDTPLLQDRSSQSKRLVSAVLERIALSGPLQSGTLEAPTSSLIYGASGFAYALLRISSVREDEKLLALADVWSNTALNGIGISESNAFWSKAVGLTEETTGRHSFHHTSSGVYCVEALVANARDDDLSQKRAIEAFFKANIGPRSAFDVSFGRAGNLLGCTSLLEATTSRASGLDNTLLRSLGNELCSEILNEIEAASTATRISSLIPLGAAHGLAGVIYAVLRWCSISDRQIPDLIEKHLEELTSFATPFGRGLRWPVSAEAEQSGGPLHASWCNGAAGLVYLWTAAYRLFAEPKYARMAAGAAWTAFDAPGTNGSLCCGLAGRAYALLNMYKHDGDKGWLRRAEVLAERAALSFALNASGRDSLFHGELGVALLAADLERPEQSCMPFFEQES